LEYIRDKVEVNVFRYYLVMRSSFEMKRFLGLVVIFIFGFSCVSFGLAVALVDEGGVVFSCSPTSVTVGSVISCTCNYTDASVDVSSITYSASPSTSIAGIFSTSCTVVDYAGNSAVSEVSYVVMASTASSDGGGRYPIYNPSMTKISEGYEVSLGEGYMVSFDMAGQSYLLRVDSVFEDRAVIMISSDPVTLEIVPGQTRKVDVDGNGVYDLSIYLESIYLGRANVVLTSISERVPAVVEGKVGIDIMPVKADEPEEEKRGFITGNVVFDMVGSDGYVVSLIVLIIIAVVLVTVYWKKIRKGFK
jgi:hypothetical protein